MSFPSRRSVRADWIFWRRPLNRYNLDSVAEDIPFLDISTLPWRTRTMQPTLCALFATRTASHREGSLYARALSASHISQRTLRRRQWRQALPARLQGFFGDFGLGCATLLVGSFVGSMGQKKVF